MEGSHFAPKSHLGIVCGVSAGAVRTCMRHAHAGVTGARVTRSRRYSTSRRIAQQHALSPSDT